MFNRRPEQIVHGGLPIKKCKLVRVTMLSSIIFTLDLVSASFLLHLFTTECCITSKW